MSLTLTLLLAAGALQGTSRDQTAVEKEIRELVLAFNDAYERNDLETYFSYYADDVTFWYPSGREGLAGYKKDWYGLVQKGGGVEKNVVSDLQVQVSPSGDAAVATYEIAVDTRQPDGTISKETAKETDVWFKRGGVWKVVHLHYNSQPVP